MRMQELESRIEKLEHIITALTVNHNPGTITDEEYLRACQCKDRPTIEKFWKQKGF